MPFVSDLILCWRRRRSGDCHSGALRWICRSRSCSLSQSQPSRRSLCLPLQHRFQTTTHLRRETLKKTFSASQKPSPTCGNLVRGSSQSRGDRGEQGASHTVGAPRGISWSHSDRSWVLSQAQLPVMGAARVFSFSANSALVS